MRRMFLVQVEMPEGCTAEEMRGYIEEAVAAWKGQMHPDEPLRDLDGDAVRVMTIPTRVHRSRRR